jgi:hypothetical protein
LWIKDPSAYRRRYYENEKPFETVETIFGKRIADFLENNHEDYKHIPQYSIPEKTIEVEIDGAKFNGRLDSFCDKELKFLDHKTGHLDKNGKVPWNKVKVVKHSQLPFYSMLIKEKYGKVKNLCHIIWIETEFKNKSIEFSGHTLEAQTRELVLTGKIKKFSRIIQEWERKKIKEKYLQITKEIHDDFKQYREKNNK